ncbi:hypothetical protein ANAPRD1_00765 [Anaplasma phagocytophilum]|nr:hypothetical protein ANAPRD1_00765 [Anaplasma phagocytophilum]
MKIWEGKPLVYESPGCVLSRWCSEFIFELVLGMRRVLECQSIKLTPGIGVSLWIYDKRDDTKSTWRLADSNPGITK